MDIIKQAQEAALGRDPVEQMIIGTFAEHAKASGARDKDQVGSRTVVSYWKRLSKNRVKHSVQMQHWKMLCELWQLWGKGGQPPQPWAPKASERFGGYTHELAVAGEA